MKATRGASNLFGLVCGVCRNFRFSDVLVATLISWIVTAVTLCTVPNTLDIPVAADGSTNTLYSYPLRFGDHMCSLNVIKECISGFSRGDIEGHNPCCPIIHDKYEDPSETIEDWSLAMISLWIPLCLLIFRGLLWRRITMFLLNQRRSSMVAYPSLSLRVSRSHSSFEPLINSTWDPADDEHHDGHVISQAGDNGDNSMNNLEEGGGILPSSTDGASDKLLVQQLQLTRKSSSVSLLSGHYVDVTTFVFWSAFIWEGICGLLVSSAYQASLTIVFKWYVGEPRPIYYALKAWASVYPLERFHLGRSSHMSFPSGHSSTAAGSLVYVALLLAFYALQLQRSIAGGVWSTAEPPGAVTLNMPSTMLPIGSDDMIDEAGSDSKSSPPHATAPSSSSSLQSQGPRKSSSSFASSSSSKMAALLSPCLQQGGGGCGGGGGSSTSCVTSVNVTVTVMAHLSILLVCLAIWVGVTRITDYWHFPHDVLAGWLLGSLTAVYAFVFCSGGEASATVLQRLAVSRKEQLPTSPLSPRRPN